MRRRLVVTCVLAIFAGACGPVGVGEPDCVSPSRDISAANILNVEAVPTAKYTPCLDELRVGWDSVSFFAESGRAAIEIRAPGSLTPFLIATVTESCDVTGATAVASEMPDVERFEDVTFEEPEVGITVIASGAAALAAARMLIEELDEEEIDDRPVRYTFDDAVDQPARSRVERALSNEQYVWVIGELDAAEGTLELRSNHPDISGRGLSPDDALDLIEDFATEVHYRGHWYFVFEGGCITYEFDASGRLAETVTADADDALGFYPAFELREIGREAGFDLGPAETDGD